MSNPAARGHGSIVPDVIQAAYQAFYAGLDVALLLSGALVAAAALVAFLTVRARRGRAAAG